MKHFIIDVTYISPRDEIEMIRPEHREFLQEGFRKGLLLFSGPRDSGNGGFIVARARSKADLEEFFEEDPYKRNRAAVYEIAPFEPVMHQSFIKNWLDGK